MNPEVGAYGRWTYPDICLENAENCRILKTIEALWSIIRVADNDDYDDDDDDDTDDDDSYDRKSIKLESSLIVQTFAKAPSTDRGYSAITRP